MYLSTTTACDNFSSMQYSDNNMVAIPLFYRAGFRHFDLNLSTLPGDKDDRLWRKQVEDLLILKEQYGISYGQAHSALYPNWAETEVRENTFRSIVRSFEACKILGIPQTVVHGLTFGSEDILPVEEYHRRSNEFYWRIADETSDTGVDILLENFGRDVKNYYLNFGYQMRDYIEQAGIPNLFVCWDTGHANIFGECRTQDKDILEMGSYLHALHIHDNWGNCDCHAIPYSGTVNFRRILEALAEIDYQGDFNFEAPDLFIYSGDGRRKRAECQPRELLSDPGAEIFEDYMRLLHHMGDWMISQVPALAAKYHKD